MAGKNLRGQLNMFDLFKALDNEPVGEVQMVSLMPEDTIGKDAEISEEAIETAPEEPVPEKTASEKTVSEKTVSEKTASEKTASEKTASKESVSKTLIREKEKTERPVMQREYEIEGKQIEIAYINYNKVRITGTGEEPEIHIFDSSKEAVDYYVQKMQELGPEE